jgi:hypothetical protein
VREAQRNSVAFPKLTRLGIVSLHPNARQPWRQHTHRFIPTVDGMSELLTEGFPVGLPHEDYQPVLVGDVPKDIKVDKTHSNIHTALPSGLKLALGASGALLR